MTRDGCSGERNSRFVTAAIHNLPSHIGHSNSGSAGLVAGRRALVAEPSAAALQAELAARRLLAKDEVEAAQAAVSIAKASAVAARESEERAKTALQNAERRAAAAVEQVAAIMTK